MELTANQKLYQKYKNTYKNYYKNNKEKLIAKQKEYYKNNTAERKLYQRQYQHKIYNSSKYRTKCLEKRLHKEHEEYIIKKLQFSQF